MEDVIFKPAEHSDIDTLAVFMRGLYEFDRMAFDEQAAREALEKFLSGEMPARVWLIESGGEAIGYVVLTFGCSLEFRGKGIVTRAARALIDYTFDELELNRAEIHCAEGNRKSRAIAQRLGFRQEGILRRSGLLYDRYVDMVIYGMLKEEWRSPLLMPSA